MATLLMIVKADDGEYEYELEPASLMADLMRGIVTDIQYHVDTPAGFIRINFKKPTGNEETVGTGAEVSYESPTLFALPEPNFYASDRPGVLDIPPSLTVSLDSDEDEDEDEDDYDDGDEYGEDDDEDEDDSEGMVENDDATH